MVSSVLIANRGEIAVRLIRGYKALGIRTIALYSDADAAACHVRLADSAERVGPAQVALSYLNAPAILEAAARAGADAVDPGYGLLSENAEFARAVGQADLVFIGPPADAIEKMGNKVTARRLAQEAGVPVVAGSPDPIGDTASGYAVAAELGFPLLVKASYGGGGRGMRLVRTRAELADALAAAAAEGTAAFGHGEVYLERAVERARHVEVQVLGDALGNVVHLGDRDCSVQRRHQKLIEEAPAPALAEPGRARLHASAVALARHVGYSSTGTVEFLYDDASQEFFFLEMNTRLQVEHPVTEMVTGIDLVAERLRVARGEAISVRQEDVRVTGHAIEARIVAEDPAAGFLPRPGTAEELLLPAGPWVRTDFAVGPGDTVPGEYDSLYGKVIAWAPTRDLARERLACALEELRVSGVGSTARYLAAVLREPSFAAAAHHTESVETEWAATAGQQATGDPVPVSAVRPEGSRRVSIAASGGTVTVRIPGLATAPGTGGIAPRQARRPDGAQGAVRPGSPDLTAPMDGVVVKVAAAVGNHVDRHAVLFVIEAMKMQIPVTAPAPGWVAAVTVEVGDSVSAGQRLGVVEPAASAS